jgi:ATP-dependent DNA helicase RecQ
VTGSADDALTPEAQALFDQLRQWRAEVAKAQNLPPFVIFHDSTLRAVAARRPQDMEALASISGIGERKLQAYGEELIRLVQTVQWA